MRNIHRQNKLIPRVQKKKKIATTKRRKLPSFRILTLFSSKKIRKPSQNLHFLRHFLVIFRPQCRRWGAYTIRVLRTTKFEFEGGGFGIKLHEEAPLLHDESSSALYDLSGFQGIVIINPLMRMGGEFSRYCHKYQSHE